MNCCLVDSWVYLYRLTCRLLLTSCVPGVVSMLLKHLVKIWGKTQVFLKKDLKY